jgi:ketosteroid isomerase-like protein
MRAYRIDRATRYADLMTAAEREVREAEERLRVAMLTNDVTALTELLHDELVFTGPDGAILGKEADLAAHVARRLRLTRLEFDDLRMEVDGHVALVTVRAILAGTFDGQVCDGNYRYTRTWRKADGRWQVTAGGVTPESGDR